MRRLYEGRLEPADAEAALTELEMIEAEPSALAPAELVWDAEDPSKAPPVGEAVSPEITGLARAFRYEQRQGRHPSNPRGARVGPFESRAGRDHLTSTGS